MAFGRKVDDAVHVLLLHQTEHALEITDIHLHEPVVRSALDVPEIGEVARVGQLVKVYYPVSRVFVDKKAHNMAAYEPGAAGYDYATIHLNIFLQKCLN